MQRQAYARVTSGVLLIAAAFEAIRSFVLPSRPGLTPGATAFLSGAFVALWLVTATFLLLRRRAVVFTDMSWSLGFFAIFALLANAVLLFVVHNPLDGSTFVGLTICAGFGFKRSFDRGLLRHGTHLDPHRV